MRALVVATAVASSSAGPIAVDAVADGPSTCRARGGERTLARTSEVAVFRMRGRGDRVAERTVVCVAANGRRERLFGERLRAVRAAGGYLIYTRQESDDRTLLELLDVPTSERTALSSTRVGRFMAAVVDARGRAAWKLTTRAAPGVRLVRPRALRTSAHRRPCAAHHRRPPGRRRPALAHDGAKAPAPGRRDVLPATGSPNDHVDG